MVDGDWGNLNGPLVENEWRWRIVIRVKIARP